MKGLALWVLQLISGMVNKKAKIGVEFVHLSIVVNVVAVVVILFLVFRRRKTEKEESTVQNDGMNETKRQEKVYALPEKVVETHRTQQTITPIHKEPKVSARQQQQPPSQLVRILEEELQLQRNRNDLLQQKQAILQAQIQALKCSPSNSTFDQQKLDLKNQLQFCQQCLQQSLDSQASLRQKLSDYQRMSISMLNHPQYLRLRDLCNTYKDTIAQLQSHLLARHDHNLDLSFNNL